MSPPPRGGAGRVDHLPGRLAVAWTDRLWPVLAGVVSAVGLVGAWRVFGGPVLALVLVGLWAFTTLVVFGALMESGWRFGRAARATLVPSVATVVVLGLTAVFPVAGWVVAAVLALTSPWSVAFVTMLRHRPRPGTSAPDGPARLDQLLVDRRFAEIAAELGDDSPHGPETG